MNRWRVAIARLGEMFRLRRLDRELDDEVQHHLDLLTDEYVRRGLSRDDARAAARRDFGGVDRTREAVRDRRGVRVLDTVGRDLRHACRQLAHARGFTTAAVVTLALGFGANTAIFSLVDGVLFRPLPYPQPDRLMALWETPLGTTGGASTGRIAVAPANLADYRSARRLSRLAAYAQAGRDLTGVGTPERILGEAVTADYFDVLGGRPALGRVLRAEENRIGADHVVVLSHGLWRDRFGSDPNVVGRRMTLDQTSCEIVGVMPADFQAVTSFAQPDGGRFWVPIAFDAELLANRLDHEVSVVARLAPGASVSAARQELRQIMDGVLQTMPPGEGNHVELAPLVDDVASRSSAMLVTLLSAVGLILLIACVNVANLLIVRSLARHREIAVRLALGASRARIVGELITQSLVLSTLGLLVGLALAALTMKWLLSVAPATIPRLEAIAINGRVLSFAGLTSLVVGIAFGLLPLRQVSRSQPVQALKLSERVVAGAWVQRWRSGLMVAEVAISLALLVGTGLMVRSLVAVSRVDLGFNPEGVLAANLNLAARYPTPDARFAFFEALAERVATLPHVRQVAFANKLPLRGTWASGFMLEPAANLPAASDGMSTAGFQAVSADYFRLFGIRLLSGRGLSPDDRKGVEPVAVVSQNFGSAFLGGVSPIGSRLRRGERMPWIRIVGVVADIRREGKEANLDPQVYLSAAQTELYPPRLAELAVRTDGNPVDLAPLVRSVVWALDPNQTVTHVQTIEDTLALGLAERRFHTALFGLFGGLAFALATIGIYGVVSYAAWQRRPEIGVRMALGADAGTIVRWLVGRTAVLVAAGLGLGIAGALALSKLLGSLLFAVPPTDALTYVTAAAVLSAVALTTSALVARSATRVDPTTALRHE